MFNCTHLRKIIAQNKEYDDVPQQHVDTPEEDYCIKQRGARLLLGVALDIPSGDKCRDATIPAIPVNIS